MTKIDMEEFTASFVHHEVTSVSISDAHNVSGNALAG